MTTVMERTECHVYSRFTVTRADGTTVKLKVQDMPAESLDGVMDMYTNIYLKEEPIHRATGIYKNEKSKNEMTQLLSGVMQMLQPHIDICCVDDGPGVGEIVGASTMYIADEKLDLTQFPVETKEIKKLFEIALTALYQYDVVKEKKVDKYYEDLGIVVRPDFRRLGIAKEFVTARRLIGKLNNIPVLAAWMTAWGTQKAGEADGWETVLELRNEDLSRQFGVVFDNAPPTCKYMVTKALE